MELDDVIQTEGGDQLLQESGDGLHLESAEEDTTALRRSLTLSLTTQLTAQL